MVKDEIPPNADRCFLTNNRHPWDLQLAEYVSEIENNRDGRLGCKEDQELLVSNLAHYRISLTETQVQDAYLERLHLFRFRIIPDGNCLFRSVSQALFGTQELHMHVRELCIEHLSQNVVDFLPFFEPPSPDEDLLDFAFSQIAKLKENSVWGGFESLMALSDLYNIEFHVILGGVVKNSSVTIHKYYLNRRQEVPMVTDSGEGTSTGDPADAGTCAAAAAATSTSSPSQPQPNSDVLPMKKVFLIWMSCGHYDLATDMPEQPVETEVWLKEWAPVGPFDRGGEGGEEEERRRKERKEERRKSGSGKRRSSQSGGEPAGAALPAPSSSSCSSSVESSESEKTTTTTACAMQEDGGEKEGNDISERATCSSSSCSASSSSCLEVGIVERMPILAGAILQQASSSSSTSSESRRRREHGHHGHGRGHGHGHEHERGGDGGGGGGDGRRIRGGLCVGATRRELVRVGDEEVTEEEEEDDIVVEIFLTEPFEAEPNARGGDCNMEDDNGSRERPLESAASDDISSL